MHFYRSRFGVGTPQQDVDCRLGNFTIRVSPSRVKMLVKMPYEEVDRLADQDDEYAVRELVRRYHTFINVMSDLREEDSPEGESSLMFASEVVDETVGDMAQYVGRDVYFVLELIARHEMTHLERFGAAKHTACATLASLPSDEIEGVAFKLLFGLPVVSSREEYENEEVYSSETRDFWDESAETPSLRAYPYADTATTD